MQVLTENSGSRRSGVGRLQERLQQVGELNKLLDAELLGAQGEVGREGGNGVGGQELAQGHAQHLATLVERGLDDAPEQLLAAPERGHAVAGHADNCRLHLWRRVEDRGFDREEVFHVVPRLDEHREDAVGLGARLCNHALGHLALDHARAAGDEVAVVEHLEEYLRGDVVGVVAGEHELPSAEKVVQVHAQEVAGEQEPLSLPRLCMDGRELRKVFSEVGDGLAVDLDGCHLARLWQQELREHTHARPNFEHGNVRTGIDGVGDAAGYREVGQEVLTEVLLRLYLLHRCKGTIKRAKNQIYLNFSDAEALPSKRIISFWHARRKLK